MSLSKREEYERLKSLVKEWNVDHYDIFELTEPNQDLEFHGVVRFFFQEGIGASVITKCIRVASSATTREVIDVLIEKFRPDMRMLSQHKYALYEVHVNGDERRLEEEEKPLFVQLNWGKDVREGRFLLRNENHPTVRDPALGFDKYVLQQDQAGFKRKLSKREKKEKRKRDKDKGKENDNGDESVANRLYEAAPETTFTRSISNPDAVMRRRRQQKLEKKLAQMNAGEGGTDSGGTLKIYGESLCPDVPYKTLFLSTADPAFEVVKEALEKYGLDKEDPNLYCLVEVLIPPAGMEYHGQKTGGERLLDDNECPLAIVIQHEKHRGHIIFQLRKRSADYQKRQTQRSLSHEDLRNHRADYKYTNVDMLPFLIEMNVRAGKPKRHILPLNVTEVVNAAEVANNKPDYAGKHFLQLVGPDIHPRHCVIAHTEGIVTVTPNSHMAETYIDGHRIFETTMLKHGMDVQFGKDKFYRFLDPRFDEPLKPSQPYQLPIRPQQGQSQEGMFAGINGSVGGTLPRSESHQWESQQRRSMPQSSPVGGHGYDEFLPASVEYFLDAQDKLLHAVLIDVNSRQLQFKLAPTYTLYMAVRHLLLARSPVVHREQLVTDFVIKTAKLTQQGIQVHHNDPSSLAFWMANSSEILHMLKQDLDVGPLSIIAQEMLAEAVQTAFHHLVRCLQGDLQRVMPAFLDPSDSSDFSNEIPRQYNMPTLTDVLDTLSATMTLLRRCRVNSALTIQLFSQLFHFINMWLFNILVTKPQLQLCTRVWGLRLKRRLGSVEAWAEKQGLELAADCHLCRIIQAAHLLQASKASSDDVTNISSTCFKLNSLQLRSLLTQYIPEAGEPAVSMAFVERVVSIAENMADELTRTDGREVRLEEDNDLHLPFLLPEDGYSCETIRGIPNGLPEFVRQLENMGICRFVLNMNSSGSWTVYMEGDQHLDKKPVSLGNGLPPSPEIVMIAFNKVKNSMGLSIVAAIGEGQSEQGIYIKAVVDGGAAALDGRLQAGDQLLEVDGKSLVGVSQDRAAELMTQTGNMVRLKVAKRAVLYHNLGSLLSQPSPPVQRAAQNRGHEEVVPPSYNGIDMKVTNGYGNSDRMRAPSTGNIVDLTSNNAHPNSYSFRRDDPRSKSTSNLNFNTTLDRDDMRQQMKPAQSVGMLHHSSTGYNQLPPGSVRQDIRSNDYENQPHFQSTVGDRSFQDGPMRPGYSLVDPYQNFQRHGRTTLHQIPYNQQQQPESGTILRNSDRSSLSSRTSSVSNRDMRPVSAYYNAHIVNRESGQNLSSRPKSEDVGSKLKDWHNKYGDPRIGFKQTNGGNSPPYSNIGAVNREQPSSQASKPTAHERLFNQQLNNRQQNLYENTSHLQQKPPGSLQQMQQPSANINHESRLTIKPPFAPQKSHLTMDMNGGRSDHWQAHSNSTDPHTISIVQNGHPGSSSHAHPPQQGYNSGTSVPFFDQRTYPHYQGSRNQSDPRFQSDLRNISDSRITPIQNNNSQYPDPQRGQDPRSMQYPNARPSYPQNVTNFQQSSDFPDGRSFHQQNPHQQSQHRYGDTNNHFGYTSDPHTLHSPTLHNGLPQDSMMVPYVDVYPEDLQPALSSHINQKQVDQQRLLHHTSEGNQFMASDLRSGHQYNSNTMQSQQPRQQPQQYQPPQQHASQQQQPLSVNLAISPSSENRSTTQLDHRAAQNGYRTNGPVSPPNYQNINFASDVRAVSGPTSQVVTVVATPLTSYSDNSTMKTQKFQEKITKPIAKTSIKERSDVIIRSAWDRDAKEKAEEEEQNELFKAREQEIAELEARPFLSSQDQERLHKLKTEHEFRRRVQEIAEKGDYEYDDDEEFAERYHNRERLIQVLKNDLEKSRQRLREFEASQQQADVSREQEWLQT